MSDSCVSESKNTARQLAYEAVDKLTPESTSVVEYQSRGHVVVIGDTQAIKDFGDLPRALSSETIEYKGVTPDSDIIITGALGSFEISVANQAVKADLIVDLTPESLLPMALKPPGYYIADTKKLTLQDFQTIKEELANLIGTFEKPKYFDYDASACAHGRSGKPGCTRCIDACPAEAITSLIDSIKVDASRCQGGGICATVCPSSAITYAYPKPRDLLTHIRTLILSYLKESLANNAGRPDLVFVTEDEQARAEQVLPAALFIRVEEVASVGPDAWLSALAWGAKSVRLFDLGEGVPDDNGIAENTMPASARNALDLHVEMTQAILDSAGYPVNVVSVISDPSELITCANMPDFDLATHAVVAGKRQAIYMAIDHLVEKSQTVLQSQSNPEDNNEAIAILPAGSIFGEVIVDKERCTLCMACVGACPANALQDGHDKPMLGLVEANCLQCGICSNTCPEGAISIAPRLLLDHKLRKKTQILHEDEPFCCISCGKPYATKSGVKTIMKKLSGHYMFEDERAKKRLTMCDDCRVRDMAEDPNTDF